MSKQPCGCIPTKPNICKICHKKVSKKKGIQCEGVCQRWIHFECLDLPVDIENDIKRGSIKIRCPCPECEDGGKSNSTKPLPTPPCCSTPRPSISPKTPSGLSHDISTASFQGNDPGQCRSSCLGLPPLPKECPLCSSKAPIVTPTTSLCSKPSASSVSTPKRLCPTPVDCNVDEICNTVSEITQEINTLMKRLKTVLAHQETCMDKECCKKRNQNFSCHDYGH